MARLILTLILLVSTICLVKSKNVITGSSLYLGQQPPGAIAEIFAPGIISLSDRYEYGSIFSRNGEEFYYAAIINQKPQILLKRFENGRWSEEITILANTKYEHNDPFLSPD
ncbi:hypothetical protein L0657_21555 [Dyadobacter sp. CY345]|uniref:hypothetical protein n=1 Tax=Dyadobacter sp. CY345 TaxID=2909335 RepID=UPI001F345525|nr:hypothetical protein [Dyadobacter sp. CY345]MCF2446558.1 hypothetical protein [Dyadobacter sp. CY345]